MRGKIVPPDAGDLHVAPLRRGLVDTAALDIVGRAAAHESLAGRDGSQLGSPAGEDHWAHPTGDLAALVADVQVHLTRVRAAG